MIAVAATFAPVAASAAVVPAVPAAAAPAAACTVSEAHLAWGFKESFRSYILGTIANGSWEPFDGAGYETPEFRWSDATGRVDPQQAEAVVSFSGGIRFEGHGGLLETVVSNPTLELDGADGGRILLDITSVSMADALAGDADAEPEALEQVPFASVDLSGAAVEQDGDTVRIAVTGAPTAITQEGYDTFGSYEAGTALDPVTFSVAAVCAAPTPTATPTPTPTEAAAPQPADTAPAEQDVSDASTGWLPWVIGGVVVAAVAAIAAFVARRRRGPASATPDADGAEGPGDGAAGSGADRPGGGRP